MSSRRCLVPLVLAAVLALSACGSSSDSVVDALPSTTAAASAESPPTTGGDDEPEQTTTDAPTTTAGSSVGPGGEAYVQAVAQALLDDEDVPLEDDQAACVAERLVALIGVDRLEQQGVTPEDLGGDASDLDFSELGLDLDEGNELYDSFGECGADMHEIMMTSINGDDELTPAAKACMEQVFNEENLRKYLVYTMVQGEDALATEPELEEIAGGFFGCAFMSLDSDSLED